MGRYVMTLLRLVTIALAAVWVAGGTPLLASPLDPPVQHCTPATVLLDGPTTIRTGTSCTWSAEAFSECTGATYTYNWYVSNTWVGSGQWYTGGRPNGVLAGQSWRLRVEASYNGFAAGSSEIYVSESASAPICVN
jgi:hypothetical protein